MNELLIRPFTLDDNVSSEVLRYTKNAFVKQDFASSASSNETAYEQFAKAFEEIIDHSNIFGAQYSLDELLGSKSVDLSAPELLKMYTHNSFAGQIPVVYTESIADFENMICKLAYNGVFSEQIKNTGASLVHGKTKAFVILSNKPYSNVPADELGLDDETWKTHSVIIRREHECLHYFTKKFYESTRNHLHDELIADFVGIVSAMGTYNAELFLKCLGVSGEQNNRAMEKRFGIYTKGLSPEAAEVLEKIIVAAAYALEKHCKTRKDTDLLNDLPTMIDFLCCHDLLALTVI